MKLFYPNPFRRSTPISKNFPEIGAPSLPPQYSDKLQRSQKRIRLCVNIIRIDAIHPNASHCRQRSRGDMPYTGVHGSCR